MSSYKTKIMIHNDPFNPHNLRVQERIVRVLLEAHFMASAVGGLPFDKELADIKYDKKEKMVEFIWKRRKK